MMRSASPTVASLHLMKRFVDWSFVHVAFIEPRPNPHLFAPVAEQIAKLNTELRGYTQQLKKARGGAKKSIKMRAVQVHRAPCSWLCHGPVLYHRCTL